MNAPTPYQGKEKYIFISYSHRDTVKVFPIISRLMENGYRVWYDQGIDPGTEWDENIALHINECGYFIAFMSSNYLGSSNCKDELNYARDLEKDRLIVYLEDVTLPAGMAMRVNRLQSIFKHTYVNENDFYEKLFAANNINLCKGEIANAAKEEDPAPSSASNAGTLNGGSAPFGEGFDPSGFNQNGPKGDADGYTGNTNVNGGGSFTPADNINYINELSLPIKSKLVAALLAFFVGMFGIHKFYLGKKRQGILYILLFWVYGVSVILGIIDGIKIITMSDESFQEKYKCRID